MEQGFENIPAGQASDILLKNGIGPGVKVNITLSEDAKQQRELKVKALEALCLEAQAYAESQGMTEDLFDELMKDES